MRSSELLERVKRGGGVLGKWGSAFAAWQPLTPRGALVLFLSIAALKYLAVPEDDLIAYILGGAGIGLLGLCALATVWISFRVKRRLEVQLRVDTAQALSQRDVPAGMVLSGSSMPPFITLEIQRRFAQAGVLSAAHLLRGLEPGEQRYLIDTIWFPHRGVWELSALRCRISDALGLCAVSWAKPQQASIEVSAPTLGIRPLPVVFGSARAGDQFSASEQRSGDLYDMKPYDPSDGVARILWKTFARSGELIVRRPEPAVIPEGEVAIYLIADKTDDYVAGALQSYLDQLRAEQIVVLFGTDGLAITDSSIKSGVNGDINIGTNTGAKREFQSTESAGYTSNQIQTQQAINRAVWHRDVGTGKGFDSYLKSLVSDGRIIHQCIVFAPLESNTDWQTHVHQTAAQHMVKLSLALVPYSIDPFAASTSTSHQARRLDRFLPGVGRRISNRPGFQSKGVLGATSPGVELFVCESAETPINY